MYNFSIIDLDIKKWLSINMLLRLTNKTTGKQIQRYLINILALDFFLIYF